MIIKDYSYDKWWHRLIARKTYRYEAKGKVHVYDSFTRKWRIE